MTQHIDVEVHLKWTYEYTGQGLRDSDQSIIRVHIDDNVDKILTNLKIGGVKISSDSQIMSQGKAIVKPEEKSFKKMNVMHKQAFTLVS